MRKFICTAIIATLFHGSLCFGQEPNYSVATVNFMEIQEILLSSLAKKKKYSLLIKEYLAQEEAEAKEEKAFEKALTDGKVDFSQMISERSRHQLHRDRSLYTKVENILHSELIQIIEELFPGKYKLILEESHFADNILYNQLVIHDITTNIKQHLLLENEPKLLPGVPEQ